MYDLLNLNDYEFEILAKDIMGKKLKVQFHRFPKGRDNGIDLCDNNNPIIHLVQVKHYINSKWSDLRNALKKEVDKVDKINPQKYFIFCSLELTYQNKREICSMFPKYINSIDQIIDKTEIIDFLRDENNKYILHNHFKLWFFSVDLLSKLNNHHAFIDCEELLFDINESIKLFVDTEAYRECLKKLQEKNVIIITGSPGVGKSTISKMIVLNYASKDYMVRYVSNNNIKDLKNTLSSSPDKKEVILLDDFLGQHYLNIKETTPNEVKTLIAYVEKNPSKKLILNSRITIINEARNSYLDFNKLIAKKKENQYIIDLDMMTNLEKAKILYNHLYFSQIPDAYIQTLRQNRRYVSIITHKNYNPRIIEHISNINMVNQIDVEDYYNFIENNLNNPSTVWDDEFRNRINECDRIFMHTLYSLTDTSVLIDTLKSAFEYRIFKSNKSTTLNLFDDVYKRLSDSLIKTHVINDANKKKLAVMVVNPSVNDYLKKKITENINEQKAIVSYAKYIEQINKMMTINPNEAINFFKNDEVKLESIDDNIYYHYLSHIIKYNIYELDCINNIQNAFKYVCINSSWKNEELILNLIENEMIQFYSLDCILIENLESAVKYFSYYNIIEIYNWLKDYGITLTTNILDIMKQLIKHAIEELILEDVNYELPEIVSNCIGVIGFLKVEDDEDMEEIYINHYYSDVEDEVKGVIIKQIEKSINKSPIFLDKSDIDFDYIYYNLEIYGVMKSYIYDFFEDQMVDYDCDDEISEQKEWEYIHELFS